MQLIDTRSAVFACDIVQRGSRYMEIHHIESTSYIGTPDVTHIANMHCSGAKGTRRDVPLVAEDVIGLKWVQVYTSRIRGYSCLRLRHSMTRAFPQQMFNHEIFLS